jgi:hypothetical protein
VSSQRTMNLSTFFISSILMYELGFRLSAGVFRR